MKKGCVVAIISVVGGGFLLFVAGIITIYVLLDQYEKSPKPPGQGELMAAEKFIMAYDDKEASGNTEEAAAFAAVYSKMFRDFRTVFFTNEKVGSSLLTKGHFMTYCYLTEDSVALLVHVPDLRNFAEDAKITLGELAWKLAVESTKKEFPKAKRLAVGVKGMLNYSGIYTGTLSESGKWVKVDHPFTDDEVLWPFFTTAPAGQEGPVAPRTDMTPVPTH